MSDEKQDAGAVAVEPTVRPVAWLCEYRSGEEFVSLAKDPMRDPDVRSAFPLVMKSAINAAVAAERERWESAIGALMPADFKQWRDSPVERPATAAWCIANAREQADQAWSQLKSAAGWLRAVDEAMVTHHAGVADAGDSYEAAKTKLNTLLCIVQDIGAYHERERICSQISETQRRFCGSGLDGDLLVHEIRAAAEEMR